jgi:anti-sigma regulatory factor (Ser/Thr protein kinase)
MTGASQRQFLKFQAVPATARPARRFVADTLRAQGATSDEIVDIALVASELVSNIIEHGDGLELSLAVNATPDAWELSVVGGRCPPDSLVLRPEKWNVARADEHSGRGLGIVRQLMDDISVDTSAGTVCVSCRRRRAPS